MFEECLILAHFSLLGFRCIVHEISKNQPECFLLQVEVLKSNVDIRVKALNDEAEKLAARWNQFKPKSDALQGDRWVRRGGLLCYTIQENRKNWFRLLHRTSRYATPVQALPCCSHVAGLPCLFAIPCPICLNNRKIVKTDRYRLMDR